MAALLDLDNPEAWQDLSAAYAPARAAGPVYVGENGSVIVLRHAQAGALLMARGPDSQTRKSLE